jgi:hypothetical protein
MWIFDEENNGWMDIQRSWLDGYSEIMVGWRSN